MMRLFYTRHLLIWISALVVSVVAGTTSPVAGASTEEIGKRLEMRFETAEIASRVVRLAAGGSYDEAEKTLESLLREQRISPDGQRVLERVYYQLSTLEQLRNWNRWCSARPTSHFPFTIRGMYFLERARFLDGSNKTLLLSDRQRKDFNQFLRGARADLEKAAELNHDDPGPPAALTALSIHLKLSRTDMEKWFERAVANDPGWLASYRAKLLYLSPWWYGSRQLMAQFADQCFAPESSHSNTYIIALDYLKLTSERLGKGLQGARFLLAPDIYRMLSTGLDRYVREYPLSPRIGLYLSLKERAVADPYVAVAAFTETLESNPEDAESRKGRIAAYLKIRQFSEAEADLMSLEQLEGETGFSRSGLGTIAFRSGQDIARAHQLIEAAIGLEDSSYRRKIHYYQRAELYRQLGRHRQAITDYGAALDEDILFEEAYFGRAQSRHALDDLEGALADLVIIKSTIKGRLTTKARSLINAYLKKPTRVAAETEAESSTDNLLSPSQRQPSSTEKDNRPGPDYGHREFLVRGLRYFYDDDFEEARKDFFRVISHEPTNAKAYFMLGEIAAHHDFNMIEACLFFKEAYRLAPDTGDYLLEYARCLYRQHYFSEAVTLLSGFINRQPPAPVDDQSLAQIHFLRGLCLEESGLIPEALDDMQKALAHAPDLKAAAVFIRDHSPDTSADSDQQIKIAPVDIRTAMLDNTAEAERLIEIGRQKLDDGDITGAKVSFLRAIKVNPTASSGYHHLGRLYFEHEQDYHKARIYYSQAIDRDNRIAHYYFDRAAIHFYFKRYDLAREDFARVLELEPADSRSLYYRGVCNHFLGDKEAARRDFQTLRQTDEVWNVEIERFRNAWQSEIDEFLEGTL